MIFQRMFPDMEVKMKPEIRELLNDLLLEEGERVGDRIMETPSVKSKEAYRKQLELIEEAKKVLAEI